MRVESMVAQQAVLAHATRRARTPAQTPSLVGSRAAGASLPAAVADRLAGLFADDPAFAAAVSAHLPAARQASALDMAEYGRDAIVRRAGHQVDLIG
jgi:hypothetical protein